MPEITILTVNWYSSPYLRRLIGNLLAKAARPEALQILIIDNTNGKDKDVQSLPVGSVACQIESIDCAGRKSSYAHAFALNQAMRLLRTEYTLVIDPDVHVFKQGWDVFCVEQLTQQGAVATGAPYPPWKVGMYHHWPSPAFCFFRTQALQDMAADWTPRGPTKASDAILFGIRQIGRLGQFLTRLRYQKYPFLRQYARWMERWTGGFSRDTGWRIAEQAKKRAEKTVLFSAALTEDAGSLGARERDALVALVQNYELFHYAGEVVLVHKYGSGGSPWQTMHGPDLSYWDKCIEMLENGSS